MNHKLGSPLDRARIDRVRRVFEHHFERELVECCAQIAEYEHTLRVLAHRVDNGGLDGEAFLEITQDLYARLRRTLDG